MTTGRSRHRNGDRGSLFFFSSRRRHTRSKRDWSSDVCSSDLRCGAALTALVGVCVATGASASQTPADSTPPRAPDRLFEATEPLDLTLKADFGAINKTRGNRSEERRVGKEGRSRRSPYEESKK